MLEQSIAHPVQPIFVNGRVDIGDLLRHACLWHDLRLREMSQRGASGCAAANACEAMLAEVFVRGDDLALLERRKTHDAGGGVVQVNALALECKVWSLPASEQMARRQVAFHF